mmetsp:Transcript_12766/g.16676  ORF Transcript_12766/g.16676 Transcript_12766/m.16676 type:complete len:93 (+) Transcript_12766:785-1063(+)
MPDTLFEVDADDTSFSLGISPPNLSAEYENELRTSLHLGIGYITEYTVIISTARSTPNDPMLNSIGKPREFAEAAIVDPIIAPTCAIATIIP